MVRIVSYKDIDRGEWETLVRESATGTWFQSAEAYALFASLPELFEPFAIGVINENTEGTAYELRGVCVGYVTKENNALRERFTQRAIILGGPCLKDDATDEEVTALMRAVSGYGLSVTGDGLRVTGKAIYIETRNFNDYSRWKGAFAEAGFAYKPHLNFHVDCRDKAMMWERLSDNRKRQIRKQPTQTLCGERLGVRGERLGVVTEQEIREWYAILEQLYRTKVKTPLWPVEFFVQAYKQGVGQFILIRHEGKIIGGSFCVALRRDKFEIINNKSEITTPGVVYEWFECGMNAEYKEQYPSVMATWAGMLYAHEQGCARYDMMGAGVPGVPYGVRDFKSEFGGQMVEHGRYLCICKPALYKIGCWGVKLLRD